MITIFDLETTGINPWEDRIVEIYINTGESSFKSLVNPGIPIPEAATKIHGITDAMVANAPHFSGICAAIRPFFINRILLGYNSRRYDTIMLHQEFERSGYQAPYQLDAVPEIDVYQVWRSVETQNLASAVRRWLMKEHENAHGAESDAMATWEVFQALRKRYDLTTEECVKRSLIASRSPSFEKRDGEYYFTFGQHRGMPAKLYPDYLEWMIQKDFDPEAQRIARDILARLTV